MWLTTVPTAPGLVMIASRFGDVFSTAGVIRRLLEEERLMPPIVIGDTRSSSPIVLRGGVDADDIA